MMVLGGLCALSATAWGADRGGSATTAKDVFPGGVRLLLPRVIHAVSGVEMNVYFDNVTLVLNPANYAFDVTCAKGIQQAERWTFTPSDKDVGSHAFTLEVRDGGNRLVARGRSTVKVVKRDAGAGCSITALLIGDSLTHASIYSQHLLRLCGKPPNPSLRLIGTHVPNAACPANRHEGYGGWTAKRFATHYTGVARTGNPRKRGSPFIYEDGGGKRNLDFARYCRDVNGGKAPDFVTIFLGCNDTFAATDQNIEGRIAEMFGHLDTLIQRVLRTNAATRIGLVLLVPPAGSQDAFGANYQCGQTRWQYKRNQHRVVERMIKRYAGKEKEGIGLIPAFVNLDCRHNYPGRKAPWNQRASASGMRLCNGVHPSPEGYRQIGDSIYCWLKVALAGAK